MKWILIYWLASNAQLVATPAPILFDDKAACIATAQTIADSWNGGVRTVISMCVPQQTIISDSCVPGTTTTTPEGTKVTCGGNSPPAQTATPSP